MKAIEIIVKGRVQGVSFRVFTKQKADQLHLSGFVKNNTDGSVYICAQGEDTDIDNFVSWCHAGSPLAQVEELVINVIDENTFSGFEILR